MEIPPNCPLNAERQGNGCKRAAAYWVGQGTDEEDAYHIGDSHRATYPTAGQSLYNTLGDVADSQLGKPFWAQLEIGRLLLSGAGDTVAAWADLFTNGNSNNYFTGETVSGVAAQDSRFLGIVGLLMPDGILAVRAKTATNIIDNAEIGIQWGKGINLQGMPFEDYVASISPSSSRLPVGFKSLDFFDEATGVATSVKTLDTATPAKLQRPADVYSSLKGNIDNLANFTRAGKGDTTVDQSKISARILQVGVPSDATSLQMYQVQRALEYGKEIGVTVKIIRIN
jgi:filamentous hemagglutinin